MIVEWRFQRGRLIACLFANPMAGIGVLHEWVKAGRRPIEHQQVRSMLERDDEAAQNHHDRDRKPDAALTGARRDRIQHQADR